MLLLQLLLLLAAGGPRRGSTQAGSSKLGFAEVRKRRCRRRRSKRRERWLHSIPIGCPRHLCCCPSLFLGAREHAGRRRLSQRARRRRRRRQRRARLLLLLLLGVLRGLVLASTSRDLAGRWLAHNSRRAGLQSRGCLSGSLRCAAWPSRPCDGGL